MRWSSFQLTCILTSTRSLSGYNVISWYIEEFDQLLETRTTTRSGLFSMISIASGVSFRMATGSAFISSMTRSHAG